MQTKGVPAASEELGGAEEGSALWTAVTLNGVNHYSGSVQVRQASHFGVLHFDAGRLVHAETGSLTGEAAFRQIMRWPGSSYTLQPEASTSQVTITRGLALLLMDLKVGAPLPEPTPAPLPPSRKAAPASAGPERLVAATEQIRLIPGVIGVLLHGRDGPVAGLGARTPEDEAALALGREGKRLGDAFGLGRLVACAARGAERLVLLLTIKEHQLTILVRADGHADAVQARIRSLLNSQS